MTDNVKQTKNETEDQELNDLLDSALQDFDKVSISNVKKAGTANSQKQTEKDEPEEKWTDDFLRQTADQFEKNFQNLLQNGEGGLEAALQKLGQTPVGDLEERDIDTDFHSAISQVLKDLTTNSESLQNEANVAAMLGQTSLEGDTGNILPFMQGMMEHLLSKDILYPSLKELSDKYPAWLEEHKATLDASDLQRYTKQSELMQKVCEEFENEKEDDAEDVKQRRFECVLKLMTEMQNYGQAPDELVGEQCSLFQFDSDGNPIFPSDRADCCIM